MVAQQVVKWHVSFTYEETQNSTKKKGMSWSNHSIKMVGTGEMIIESADISKGHLQITTDQGDKLLSSVTSGYVSEKIESENRDPVMGLEDTRKDSYTGAPQLTWD